MKIEQRLWSVDSPWTLLATGPSLSVAADLVLVFGARPHLADPARYDELRSLYPLAIIIAASTAGEIVGNEVRDNTIVATAIDFERTPLRHSEITIQNPAESRAAGAELVRALPWEELRHVFVISDGQSVNGSELVRGITSELPKGVQVTGGLAGDAALFTQTLVGLNAPPREGVVVALGFYGNAIRIGYGSRGGWDSFGQDRIITRSEGNILYELDGRSALGLYKEYLGERAAELPASALLFPLSVKINGYDPIVRTILSIDEATQSMTFAGDMPIGARARLMKANFDRLVDGAFLAAKASIEPLSAANPELAILISCVGRKLVLDERIEEEVESVREVVGREASICGFYSYGEISPFTPNVRCELHNQTMTITTFREA